MNLHDFMRFVLPATGNVVLGMPEPLSNGGTWFKHRKFKDVDAASTVTSLRAKHYKTSSNWLKHFACLRLLSTVAEGTTCTFTSKTILTKTRGKSCQT